MKSEVVVLGVGMHPWGKWGRNFTEYGIAAARDALKDAGLQWQDIQFVAGGNTMRCGFPGYVAGATFAEALGWTGVQVVSTYAACASGAQALQTARAHILSGQCEVAMVIGADTTPKGFLAPQAGERPDDRDWVRFRLGITNAVYFGLYAQKRMDTYGTTLEDLAQVKVKNSRHGLHNKNARYRKEYSIEEVMASNPVATPLRLLDICATSDGGAAVIICSAEYARKLGKQKQQVWVSGISTETPIFPMASVEMPYISTDSWVADKPNQFRSNLARKAYEESGVSPKDISFAEVYDLSTSLELDWCEDLSLCQPGEADQLLRSGDTSVGGKLPINPSGGLGCFGEAVPAQALAQICEMVWQLRGQADQRQVPGARVAISANQGLFGHGSATIAHN